MAASIAFGLRNLPPEHLPTHDDKWLIWIVGARESMEGRLARGGHLVEVLDALYPTARGFDLLLIGPEMEPAPNAYRGTLHQLRADGRIDRPPDLVVLFNSGVGTMNWPIVEPWLPTMALLLSLDRPLLLTCFHPGESKGEQEILVGHFGARVLTPPADNPLAHGVPTDAIECRDAEGEASLEAEMVKFAEVCETAYERKKERDAAAWQEDDAKRAAQLYAQYNDTGGIETSNSRYCWLRGSSLRGAALDVGAVRSARKQLRGLCSCFALSRLSQWLAGLQRKESRDGSKGVNAGLEGRSFDAMVLAESFKATAIAKRALELGAKALMEEALNDAIALGYTRRQASERANDDDDDDDDEAIGSNGGMGSTYTGLPAAIRLGRSCDRGLARLAVVAESIAAVERAPTESETTLKQVQRWRVVFKGQFVHMRAEPSVTAASCGQLARDSTFFVDAVRGAWVRVANGEGWVLTVHPLYGALVVSEDAS